MPPICNVGISRMCGCVSRLRLASKMNSMTVLNGELRLPVGGALRRAGNVRFVCRVGSGGTRNLGARLGASGLAQRRGLSDGPGNLGDALCRHARLKHANTGFLPSSHRAAFAVSCNLRLRGCSVRSQPSDDESLAGNRRQHGHGQRHCGHALYRHGRHALFGHNCVRPQNCRAVDRCWPLRSLWWPCDLPSGCAMSSIQPGEKFISALVMGSAIPLMHYTGMWAASFYRSGICARSHPTPSAFPRSALWQSARAVSLCWPRPSPHPFSTGSWRQKGDLNLAQERELYFQTMAEAVPEIIWTADPDGADDFFNRRWFDYTGYDVRANAGHRMDG